jgi:Outer membrane protein beta-barrel domain
MEEHYNHPVDRYFQENLSFHESDPSRKVWNNIANQLDNVNNREELRRSRSRFALSLALTGIFVFLNFALKDYSRMAAKTQNLPQQNTIASTGFVPVRQVNLPTISESIVQNDIDPDRQNINFPAVQKPGLIADARKDFLIPLTLHGTENPDNKLSAGSGPTENNSLIKVQPGKKGGISLEPFYIKEFAGYNFADNDIEGEEIEKRERTMFSATVGFFVNYSLNRHWLLQTGLAYSWSASNIDSFATYAKKGDNGAIQYKLNTVSGYSYLNSPSPASPMVGDSVHTNGTHSHLRYISIPLIVSYRIPMKRFSALIGAGATFNVLSSAVVETDIYHESFSKHEAWLPLNGLKKTNFGVIVKAEIAYQVKKQWSINLMSSFKNTLGPINLNSAVSAYPYNFGVGLGVNYQF